MRPRRELFPINTWPSLADAVTLALATFVLVAIVALLAQRSAMERLVEKERELVSLTEAKTRVERRLASIAATGIVEIDEGKVILQGEVLFDSGSPALHPEGRAFLRKLAAPLAALLAAEPDQMVMIGGHSDDRPIRTPVYPSNWELSSARAMAVMHVLVDSGVPAARIVAAGFGEHHPRAPNADAEGRRRNRRIEILIVPIHAVSSR